MAFHKTVSLSVAVGVLLGLTLALPHVSSARDTYTDESSYRKTALSAADRQSLEQYLDTNWQIADDLYSNPELITDREYVRQHPSLRRWLVTHPRAARAIRANPRAELWYDRDIQRDSRDGDDTQRELSDRDRRSWEDFLDTHETVARELSRNPDLIRESAFVHRYEALDDWLESHREAANIIKENPANYVRRSREPASTTPAPPTAEDVRAFEQYLDREWEIADALYREPELINSSEFLRNNPSLADWLREHPRMATAVRSQPRAYLWRQRGATTIDDFLRQILTPRR